MSKTVEVWIKFNGQLAAKCWTIFSGGGVEETPQSVRGHAGKSPHGQIELRELTEKVENALLEYALATMRRWKEEPEEREPEVRP